MKNLRNYLRVIDDVISWKNWDEDSKKTDAFMKAAAALNFNKSKSKRKGETSSGTSRHQEKIDLF